MSKVVSLTKYKEAVAQAQLDQAKMEGTLKSAYDNLKKEHNVSTLEKAVELDEKLRQKEAKLEKQFSEIIDELEENYEWS